MRSGGIRVRLADGGSLMEATSAMSPREQNQKKNKTPKQQVLGDIIKIIQ